MSRVIVFCGLPASGKTTLAKAVSKKMNIFCLHKDALKERLYDLLDGKTLEDSKNIGRAVIETMLRVAEDSLENEVDVILESPFNHPDNPKRFQEWLKKYAIDLCVIVCSVDDEERNRRHAERARHPGHHDKERLNHYPFHKDEFDYTQMPGRKLFLNTTKPIEKLLSETLEFLG